MINLHRVEEILLENKEFAPSMNVSSCMYYVCTCPYRAQVFMETGSSGRRGMGVVLACV